MSRSSECFVLYCINNNNNNNDFIVRNGKSFCPIDRGPGSWIGKSVEKNKLNREEKECLILD